MQRITTATKAANLFGAGKDGFKDGDLVAGVFATDLNAAWFNGAQEELLAIIETAGLAADGATLTQVRQAIDIMIRKRAGATAVAGGTADAITGDFVPDLVLVNGATVSVKASAANATTTPTFSPDGLAAKTIVKGNNQALAVGDIAGAGHWLELKYDLTLDKWVLLNPATGVYGGMIASSMTTVAVTSAITTAMIGGTVLVNAAGATTQTLPAAGSVAPGRRIEFMDIGAGAATVQRAGADNIKVNNTTVTSLALGAGDTVVLESDGVANWYAVGGSAQLQYSAAFGASKAGSGYQKLPSGVIVQWGGTASIPATSTGSTTFPLAFPTACWIVNATFTDGTGVTRAVATNVSALSATAFSLRNPDAGASQFSWFAIGN